MNKLFLSISLMAVVVVGGQIQDQLIQTQPLQAEVASCQNDFDQVDVCQLRS